MFSDLEKYKSLDFFAKQVVEGFVAGLHRSPFHGFSVEFAEHRQYNAGESTRNIDWRLFARSDKLFVKQYEEETNLRCQIVIDQSGSMLFPIEGTGNLRQPNKLTFAVYASALLVELLSKGRDAFGLTLLSDGVDFSSQVRSSGTHKHYVLQKLQSTLDAAATVKPGQQRSTTNIAESLHQIAEQMHRRSLIVIFTDAFVDEQQTAQLIDALRHLRHNRHEVLLFHTYDAAKELALDYGNQPTEFIDLESGVRLRLQPDQLAQSYQKEMARRTLYIKQRAIQYRVDYQPVDVSLGFEPVMLPFLIKRAKCN